MFITRPPFQQKRNFNFSSTLAGKIYNNKQFLSSCSYLETEIKLSTAGSEEDQLRINSQKRFSLTNNDIRKTGALSAAEKSGNVSGASRRLSVTDRKTSKMVIGDEPAGINVGQTAFAIFQHVLPSSKKPQRKLKRKLAFNPQTDPFYSPFVYIRLIDKITDLKEVDNKSIRVNFQKIYKKLIRTQLMGQFTANFMQTVERYIRQIIQANEMYCNPFEIQLQPQLTTISRKNQFLQQIIQLWSEGNSLKLHQLIKFYCIPKEQTSQKMLQDLLEQLRMQAYQKKSCNRDIQYVLLTDEGVQIKHISEIYFSTMQLLMAPKQTANIDYDKYRYLLQQRDKSLKMTMRQSIKHHFVQRIVASRIQNKLINYQPNPHQYTQYRRQAVQQATVLLQSKSKLRLQARRNQKELSQDFDMFQDHSSRDDDLFTNFVLRKQKEKNQYQLILEKLRKILDPKHIYQIRSRLDEKTQEQFQKLHLFNDKYDITYNHHPQNNSRMFLINLIENSSIFNTKSTEQLQKLLNMLESVYGTGMDNLNQIQFWQFKEIYETAHGVADKSVITKFVINYLSFDEFGEMSKKQFFNLIQICLPGIGRPQRMAKQILWNFLQRMKLIQNNSLLRIKIQIWYQPVRIIFLLFLSIIFGGNYESIEQMLQDLLNHLD